MPIYPHTIDTFTTTESGDAHKGTSRTIAATDTGVECFVQPSTQGKDSAAQQDGHKVLFNVFFPTNPGFNDTHDRAKWIDQSGETHLLKFISDKDATVGFGNMYKVTFEEESVWPEVIPTPP